MKMPTRMSICMQEPGGLGSAVRHHQLSTHSTKNGAAIIYANDCSAWNLRLCRFLDKSGWPKLPKSHDGLLLLSPQLPLCSVLLSAVENLCCLPVVFAHLKAHGLLVADIQTDFPATHNNVGNDDKN